MKPWQIALVILVPGGLFALAVLALLRAREQPVSSEWLRAQSYDRSGY